VKDRAALFIIEDAMKRGLLEPGGVIVEGTAGNTGIGLALVGNALGFRTVIVIPDTQSQEKKDTLRLCGAELVEVPAVPYSNPNNYVKVSGRIADEMAKTEPRGAIWANQFDNVANRQGHLETTGPEIWEQTDGKIDGFVSAVGTGGTLAGVGAALKAQKSTSPIKFPIPRRWRSCSICSSMRASASAARPASMSPARFGSRRRWAAAIPSSPCSPTTGRGISRSCSIPSSCARKTCRCRRGWNGTSMCPT
jgi:cysteine synthase A